MKTERKSQGAKVHCPACGATSGDPAFGRDGSPRRLSPLSYPGPTPEQAHRRARAEGLRRANRGAL